MSKKNSNFATEKRFGRKSGNFLVIMLQGNGVRIPDRTAAVILQSSLSQIHWRRIFREGDK